jgi:hypothetical protein
MLKMEMDGLITLPARRNASRAGRVNIIHTSDGEPGDEICCQVGELCSLQLDPVDSMSDKRLWAELVNRYHYLGYKALSGAQLRYLIRSEGRVLGCIGWSAAAWKTAPRDLFIGWTQAQREHNLEKVINNARYLILPWVKVPSLASKALAAGRLADTIWISSSALRDLRRERAIQGNLL